MATVQGKASATLPTSTEPAESDVVSTLKKAKHLIEVNGWVKQTMCNSKGQVCLLGGIAKARGLIGPGPCPLGTDFNSVYEQLLEDPAVLALASTILSNSGYHNLIPTLSDVYQYNDEDERTLDDVLATLDEAIATYGTN